MSEDHAPLRSGRRRRPYAWSYAVLVLLVAGALVVGVVDRSDDTRNLRVCLKNLRQKLEPNPSRPHFIVTEAGLGYRLRVSDAVD